MSYRELAPVVLFVFKRLRHTERTVSALSANTLAKESDLFIFCDGAKNDADLPEVNRVKEYVRGIVGFRSVILIERQENFGLAKNIIEGVSDIIKKEGRVIVLEDDLITSPFFLSYMNRALDHYEDHEEIWHIAGWNYPIETKGLDDTFIWRSMQCWGWATWSRRWQKFEKKPHDLIKRFSADDIYRFDLDGIGIYWKQVLENHRGGMNSWAVFWYATIFLNGGLCISPAQSYVQNIGFDGSGEHTKSRSGYLSPLNEKEVPKFSNETIENEIALNRIKLFYREREEPNLTFSKNLNALYALLDGLRKSSEHFILYGAGTGALTISSFLGDAVDCFVDRDPGKIGTFIHQKEVYALEYLTQSSYRIIITPFGRSGVIIKELQTHFSLPIDRFITLDIFR